MKQHIFEEGSIAAAINCYKEQSKLSPLFIRVRGGIRVVPLKQLKRNFTHRRYDTTV